MSSSAATVFEEETRFGMQDSMRLPTLFWLFTDPNVGPYFLSKVVQVVQPNWILPINPCWAASDEEQAEIDLLFTDEFHRQFLIGLKQLALNKCLQEEMWSSREL